MKANKSLAVSENGFIFNPATGDSFSVNSVGLDIINLIREGKSETEIVNAIVDRYQVDSSTAEKDLMDFANVLANHQLIERYD